MARSKRNREIDRIEAIFKLVLTGIILTAFAMGGVGGFTAAFRQIAYLLVFGTIAVGAIIGIYYVIRRWGWTGPAVRLQPERPMPAYTQPAATKPRQTSAQPPATPRWTRKKIGSALEEIDWYQFEKFSAALLEAEGYSVERQGGARPDGGVDLVGRKDGSSTLVQCKHWRTWKIKEPVVRELLGSMTHFRVNSGAIYTLKGWTGPAAEFAASHGIQLVDGEELARRAVDRLSQSQLDAVLDTSRHHCPRCEAPMVWRTGDFEPFWGCSTYPRCRGILKHNGAK